LANSSGEYPMNLASIVETAATKNRQQVKVVQVYQTGSFAEREIMNIARQILRRSAGRCEQ
jgi:hypothetical protein